MLGKGEILLFSPSGVLGITQAAEGSSAPPSHPDPSSTRCNPTLQPSQRGGAGDKKSLRTQGEFSSQFLCHRGRAAPQNSPPRQEGSMLILHLPIEVGTPLFMSLSPAQPGRGDIGSAAPLCPSQPSPTSGSLISLPTVSIPAPELCFAPSRVSPPRTGPCPWLTAPACAAGSYSHLEFCNSFPPPLARALFCPHPCALPASRESLRKGIRHSKKGEKIFNFLF